MTQPCFRLKPRAALESGEANEGHVLIDTHTATICACNDTAWDLLSALRTGACVDDLTALVTAQFAVGEPDARRDITDFLHRLGVMGLVDETR